MYTRYECLPKHFRHNITQTMLSLAKPNAVQYARVMFDVLIFSGACKRQQKPSADNNSEHMRAFHRRLHCLRLLFLPQKHCEED